MISHKHGVIFVHIPKCAGSSVETLFGVKPFNFREYNANRLVGWSDWLKMHVHHAPASVIRDLAGEQEWSRCLKFTMIRNPFARAVSGYFWLKKTTGLDFSFEDYINKEGEASEFLNSDTVDGRGVHLETQMSFLDEELDYVCRAENYENDVSLICDKLKIPFRSHHVNQTVHPPFWEFLNKSQAELVRTQYLVDFVRLGYQLECTESQTYTPLHLAY